MASSLETILNAYNDKIVANKLGEEQRFLIFSIERHPVRAGSLLVGGLADRLKGIMTAFYGAVLTGRRFALHWETPLPLERNLQPSRYDWKFKNTVKFLPKDEPIQHYDFIDQSQIFDDIHHTNMETDLFRDNQIVIVNINSYRVQSLKPYFEEVTGAPISYNAFFTTGFRFLFQFNEKETFSAERARVRALLDHHDGVYGVHLRTGAGNGWNDPMLDDWQNYDKVLDAAFSFAKDDGCVSPAFYFVSDSIEA